MCSTKDAGGQDQLTDEEIAELVVSPDKYERQDVIILSADRLTDEHISVLAEDFERLVCEALLIHAGDRMTPEQVADAVQYNKRDITRDGE